jgi:hypothetical protein
MPTNNHISSVGVTQNFSRRVAAAPDFSVGAARHTFTVSPTNKPLELCIRQYLSWERPMPAQHHSNVTLFH